jgi:mRNA-degrading endonuclease RelE of RelBE toxin-antitoxin system
LKRGRALFDDIDADILLKYIDDNSKKLTDKLGDQEFSDLKIDVESLLKHYCDWRGETRFTRICKYFAFKKIISKVECDGLLSGEKSKSRFMLTTYFPRQFQMINKFICRKTANLAKAFNPLKWTLFFIKSGLSRKYRIEKSQNFVIRRIDEWRELNRISENESEMLKKELYLLESNQFLSDFGVFLALKPFGYFVKLFIIPFFLIYGWLSPETAVFIIVFFSLSVRFLYAFFRSLEDLLLHKSFPYIALLVAPIPSVGTLAYPCQMLHSAIKGHTISQFIMYEVFSTISKKIPIWGGDNSEVEYFLNRCAYKMIKATE